MKCSFFIKVYTEKIDNTVLLGQRPVGPVGSAQLALTDFGEIWMKGRGLKQGAAQGATRWYRSATQILWRRHLILCTHTHLKALLYVPA